MAGLSEGMDWRREGREGKEVARSRPKIPGIDTPWKMGITSFEEFGWWDGGVPKYVPRIGFVSICQLILIMVELKVEINNKTK